jgi:hypothetical protein
MRNFLRGIRGYTVTCFMFAAVALSACAGGPRLVQHTFAFDVIADSPDVELLDYRYGNSKLPVTSPSDWALKGGRIRQQGGTSGAMPVGESLYVKWLVKTTGVVLSDTVNLVDRLPKNITNHELYFVIRGQQLHLYLVGPDPRPANFPIVGPKKYQYQKVYSIYPTSTIKE